MRPEAWDFLINWKIVLYLLYGTIKEVCQMHAKQRYVHCTYIVWLVVFKRGLISECIFNLVEKNMNERNPQLSNEKWKSKERDFVHLFEDGTKLKISSENKPPLLVGMCCGGAVSNWNLATDSIDFCLKLLSTAATMPPPAAHCTVVQKV